MHVFRMNTANFSGVEYTIFALAQNISRNGDQMKPLMCMEGIANIIQYVLLLTNILVLFISAFIIINKHYDFRCVPRSFVVMFLIFMITGICVAMIIVFWINPKNFIPLNYIPIAIVSCGSLVIILCLLTIMVYMTKLVRDDYPCLLWLLLLIDCIILIATVAVVILVNVYCSGESNLKLIAELNYIYVDVGAAIIMLLFGVLLSLKVIYICTSVKRIERPPLF